MTGPTGDYLDQLRASLPTKPAETSRILAEAEDHLRESVAAGLRAGLTETEAQEAAISAFGSVRAVVRAHQTGRTLVAAALRDGALALSCGTSVPVSLACSCSRAVIWRAASGVAERVRRRSTLPPGIFLSWQ